jgi:alpha-glucoside transport system substrate-binding protein
MDRMGFRHKALVLPAAMALLFAACSSNQSPGASGGGGLSGQTVKIIATWTGDEQKAFLQMVAPWEKQTGAKVSYTGTRDINTILATGVASGVLPDLAGLPGPGQMNEYAKAGALKTLDNVIDLPTYKSETAKVLVDLGTTTDGKIGGVFIKSAIKGLIWFSPTLHDYSSSPPKTWDELKSQATANKGSAQAIWCLGVESGAASGWPGTDWIEDFVLRQSGPQAYNDWTAGKIKFSDPKIKQAWQAFGDVAANSFGGSSTINATAFQTAGDPLFKSPPGCEFLHQASFITGLGAFKAKKSGTDYNFFPFPDIDPQYAGAVEGAGDLFGMFHDTEAAKSLMKYLVTAPAQDVWVKIGGALSANKNATSYPDDISKRSAALLQNAKIFAFDASDLMPNVLQNAFLKGIVDYIKTPSSLDQILTTLDAAQASAQPQGSPAAASPSPSPSPSS